MARPAKDEDAFQRLSKNGDDLLFSGELKIHGAFISWYAKRCAGHDDLLRQDLESVAGWKLYKLLQRKKDGETLNNSYIRDRLRGEMWDYAHGKSEKSNSAPTVDSGEWMQAYMHGLDDTLY